MHSEFDASKALEIAASIDNVEHLQEHWCTSVYELDSVIK